MKIVAKEFNNMNIKIQEQIDTIRKEKEKVETLEKSRKQFFDNVTHEIKTPLTAIIGYSEMIKDNIVADDEFKRKSIERIYDESERLNLLVLDLIKISKGVSTIDENIVKDHDGEINITNGNKIIVNIKIPYARNKLEKIIK